jgi:hypothetical protein
MYLIQFLLTISVIWVFVGVLSNVECFIPAKIIDQVIDKADDKLKLDFGEVSDTLVHEEITRRGIIQSVVRYFYDQPNGTNKINLNKINNDYYNLRALYHDYYGKWYCVINLDKLLRVVFQPNVAVVDLDSG